MHGLHPRDSGEINIDKTAVETSKVDQAIDLLADAGHHPKNIGLHLRIAQDTTSIVSNRIRLRIRHKTSKLCL